MKRKRLIFGFPKGSLEEKTYQIFETAGFNIAPPGRGHTITIDDPELEGILLRPQEIPMYVARGELDAGISGSDWISESGAKVIEVADLEYAKQTAGKVKWMLAVPESSPVKTVKDLSGKTISTEIVRIVKNYLKRHHVKANVVFSWGATEAKAPRFADAIVDLTETGASLRANKLRVVDTVFESKSKLIASREAYQDSWKCKKTQDIALLLKGVVDAEETVVLMAQARDTKLEHILDVLPSFEKPTVHKITGENWYSIEFGAKKSETRDIMPRLKRMGCENIIEMPIVSYSR